MIHIPDLDFPNRLYQFLPCNTNHKPFHKKVPISKKIIGKKCKSIFPITERKEMKVYPTKLKINN